MMRRAATAMRPGGPRRCLLGLSAGLAILFAATEAVAFRPAFTVVVAVEPPPVIVPPEPEGRIEVLPPADVTRYAEIFRLQEDGKWAAADKLIRQLEDRRLLGHVLAQRYLHPTAYRSKYRELRDWLADYADLPDARRIYRLALKRKPKGARRPHRPVISADRLGAPSPGAAPYRSEKRLSRAQHRRVAHLQAQIRRNLRRTRLTVTEHLLASREVQRLFDTVQVDDAKTSLAAAWFYYGNDDKALALAAAAAARSGTQVPIAHWIAGLAAWRLERLDVAARHFEALALSREASGWNASAGAYWAARISSKRGEAPQVDRWLAVAAGHPRTFYGLLARHVLGLPPDVHFETRRLTQRHVETIAALPAGGRALALIQVGERNRAERELLGITGWKDTPLAEALLALSQQAQLPTVGFKLAQRLVDEVGGDWAEERLDAWLYPIPPWQPRDGFAVDRALVYALMRQESSFNPLAKSPDGARGLMQLMPRTASFISDGRRFRGAARHDLFDPELNIELGQRYLERLLDNRRVEGDLFRLAVAYNGGPGNLAKWQRHMDYGNDPLLFIESLPTRETRLFIERVLTNLWIYRERLGQPAPALDAIAGGQWPSYQALDLEEQAGNGTGVASRHDHWWVLR